MAPEMFKVLTRKLYSTLIDRRAIFNDVLHPCENLITGTEHARLESKGAKRVEGSMIKTVISHFSSYRSNRCDGKIRSTDSDLFGLQMIHRMINDRNNAKQRIMAKCYLSLGHLSFSLID